MSEWTCAPWHLWYHGHVHLAACGVDLLVCLPVLRVICGMVHVVGEGDVPRMQSVHRQPLPLEQVPGPADRHDGTEFDFEGLAPGHHRARAAKQ